MIDNIEQKYMDLLREHELLKVAVEQVIGERDALLLKVADLQLRLQEKS